MANLKLDAADQAAQLPMAQAGLESRGAIQAELLSVDVNSFIAYARSLPLTISAAQRKFGLGIYREMRQDGAVMSSDRKLKQETLAKKFRIEIPEDASDEQREIGEYEERCIANMEIDLSDVSWEMLDCIAYGHTLAEITWEDGVGEDKGYDILKGLRVIPPHLYTIVVDTFGRFLGVIGRRPGKVPFRWMGPIMQPLKEVPSFVPYWKLVILSHCKEPGDYRGVSRYDGAYNPFRAKKENWANWLYYQRKFGRIRTFVTLGPNVEAKNPLSTPEQEWTAILAASNYDISAIPSGSQVQFEAFVNAWQPYGEIMSACNREISLSITGGSRSNMEGEKSGLGNSDSEVAQEGVDLDTDQLGQLLCRAITHQVLRDLVRQRYGPAARPCPLIMHRDEDEFNETADALSLKFSDLEPEQQDEVVTKRLGLKPSVIAPEERRRRKEVMQAPLTDPKEGDLEPDDAPPKPAPKKRKAK